MKGHSGIWLAAFAAIVAPLQVSAADLCDEVAARLRAGQDDVFQTELDMQDKAQRIDLEKPLPAPFSGQKARFLAETEAVAPRDLDTWNAVFGVDPHMINQTWVFLDALPNSDLRRIRTPNEGTGHCESYAFFYIDGKGLAHPVPVKDGGGDGGCGSSGNSGYMVSLNGITGYMSVDTDYRNYNETYDVRVWRSSRFTPGCTMSVTYALNYDVTVIERDIYAGFLLRQGEKLARRYTADFVGATPRGQDQIFRDYANGNAATYALIQAFYKSAVTSPQSDNVYFYPVHYDGKVYLVSVMQGWYSGYKPGMELVMYGWQRGRAQKLATASVEVDKLRVATLDIRRSGASGKPANN
jgi:hypothetical protein